MQQTFGDVEIPDIGGDFVMPWTYNIHYQGETIGFSMMRRVLLATFPLAI